MNLELLMRGKFSVSVLQRNVLCTKVCPEKQDHCEILVKYSLMLSEKLYPTSIKFDL